MPINENSTPLAEDRAAHQTALLIIDMLSDWRFPDAPALLEQAVTIARPIAALKARCKAAGIPAVYVNDNQGRWRSDFRTLVREAIACEGGAAEICQLLAPEPTDYFVLKPKHSGFYETPLNLLLQHVHATRLILTGVSTEHCVLMTAADAHMRDFEVLCPADCSASIDPAHHTRALAHLREALGISTEDASRLELARPQA